MRTVDYEILLRGVNALLTGQNELPSTLDSAAMRACLDMALREAWRAEWWPDLMLTERRYFRPNWLAASTYNKTDEVYDAATQKYFQCLRDSVTGSSYSPTDSTGDERSAYWAECKSSYQGNTWASGVAYAVGDIVLYAVDNNYYQCHTAHTSSGTLIPTATGGDERWGVLTAFLRYVDKEATGQTVIGDTFDVKTGDARVTNQYDSLEWQELENRVYVRNAVTRCYIDFRKQVPELTGDEFDEDATYAVGDQVLFAPNGGRANLYDCLTATSAGESPSSASAKWQLVEIPRIFKSYLIWSAYAKMLEPEDRARDRANAERTAGDYLTLETDVIHRQQGQTPRMSVRTY